MNRLQDVLAGGRLQPARAKFLARQLAEELLVAHEHGVSHGELNLANVLLVGANNQERVVIAGCDGGSDIGDDIYAFGMVLDALLPGHRLVSECTAPNLYERPDCFELILEELQDFSDRRTWIGTLLIGVVMVCLFLRLV